MTWVLIGFGIFLLALAQWSYHFFDYEFEDAVMQSFAGITLIILAGTFYIMEKLEVKKNE